MPGLFEFRASGMTPFCTPGRRNPISGFPGVSGSSFGGGNQGFPGRFLGVREGTFWCPVSGSRENSSESSGGKLSNLSKLSKLSNFQGGLKSGTPLFGVWDPELGVGEGALPLRG